MCAVAVESARCQFCHPVRFDRPRKPWQGWRTKHTASCMMLAADKCREEAVGRASRGERAATTPADLERPMRRSKSALGTAQARLVSSDSQAALPAAVRCGPRGFRRTPSSAGARGRAAESPAEGGRGCAGSERNERARAARAHGEAGTARDCRFPTAPHLGLERCLRFTVRALCPGYHAAAAA